jgi:diadenosine tetraphosphate (Ap4A) HIT family hydrolase
MHSLLTEMRTDIMKVDSSVRGFNIGTNNGSEAGQTILHSYLHLIPRRKGDIDDPTGGVRGVIPDKRVY